MKLLWPWIMHKHSSKTCKKGIQLLSFVHTCRFFLPTNSAQYQSARSLESINVKKVSRGEGQAGCTFFFFLFCKHLVFVKQACIDDGRTACDVLREFKLFCCQDIWDQVIDFTQRPRTDLNKMSLPISKHESLYPIGLMLARIEILQGGNELECNFN